MDPITTVMRQCRLFDGIPEEKYQNVLACLRGETKLFRKDAILPQIGECQKRPGVVMDGTLRISLYSEDGNLVTIERLGRGVHPAPCPDGVRRRAWRGASGDRA